MNSVNGHAQKDSVPTSGPPPRMLEPGVLPLRRSGSKNRWQPWRCHSISLKSNGA